MLELSTLGNGSFGETYLAEDLDIPTTPKLKCVVKHLRPQNTQIAVIQLAQSLFNREAEVLYRRCLKLKYPDTLVGAHSHPTP